MDQREQAILREQAIRYTRATTKTERNAILRWAERRGSLEDLAERILAELES